MTENTLLALCDVQSRLVALLFKEIEKEGDPATRARRLEAAVPVVVEFCDRGGAAWDGLLMALLFSKIKKTQVIGRIARDYVPRTLTMLEEVRRAIDRDCGTDQGTRPA